MLNPMRDKNEDKDLTGEVKARHPRLRLVQRTADGKISHELIRQENEMGQIRVLHRLDQVSRVG